MPVELLAVGFALQCHCIDVDVLTGQKTVLSYLLKPVLKAKAYALRER